MKTGQLSWLAIRGTEPGALFVALTKHGGIKNYNHLSTSTIYNIITQTAKNAGVGHVAPHDLRRTFVTSLLDAGVDVMTVSRAAGHANLSTTQRYDHKSREKAARAVSLMSPVWEVA